ncbi:MAG TPA: NAD(P)-binding domain-containing protein [Candidatus Sulfomarinibacteraceae bacterium]|nr:NAD(P)-binding domain-containing protein [Candidatus Sulfomarinibacteraceae bacterium]
MADDGRPYPPGEYPVLVIGSGPGGLQVAYFLSRLGIGHATISADPGPGGMFRRWPFFQRLLSWTKPYAPADRHSRAFERWDWNSLLADEPELRGLQAEFMDGSSDFPSRPEMEANLAAFAERAGIDVRYGCTWESTRREEGADGQRFVVGTSDGEYRCRHLVVAVGVAEPYSPATPGIEHTVHYADTRAAETYAGKRLFIVGKQNSGFELASGLLQWASRITLASPSPAKTSIETRSLVGVRARYVQPFEDSALGGGVDILSASIAGIAPVAGGIRVDLKRSDNGMPVSLDVDEVISATGFTCPLVDLPALGVATFGQSRLPAQTAFWESATVPGIHFAGTITQGASGLKKHGIPSYSGAVQGHRYNSRILVRRLAESSFGVAPDAPPIALRDLLDYLLAEATRGPELWHQKAYLARVVSVSPDDGIRDRGILPLSHFLDTDGPDAVAMTVEADGEGAIYPVAYIRRTGRVEEHAMEAHPLNDFEGSPYRRHLGALLDLIAPGASAA